jgi:hypothetical protein
MREHTIMEETFLCGPCWGYITRTSSVVVESVESCTVGSDRLVAEAGDSSGTQRKGMSAIKKQWLVKTEKTLCML